MTPKVSVVLPVYNGERFVRRAIQSILEQTFADFELLVLDDCSSDGSRDTVATFRDPRIRLLVSPENRGIGPTLNQGLLESKGEYVARMDADDVSFPRRLEVQAAFLDNHPDVDLCGARALPFQQDAEIDFARREAGRYESGSDLRMGLLFGPGVIHPTVMFRRGAFLDRGLCYKPLRYAQDYELWTRAFFLLQPAVLPDTVLFYRVHRGNAAGRTPDTQELVKGEIWAPLLQRLGAAATPQQLEVHSQLADLRVTPDLRLARGASEWTSILLSLGRGKTWWDAHDYRRMLSLKLLGVLQYATRFGLRTLLIALRSELHPLRYASLRDQVKFLLKCLLRYHRESARSRG